MREEAIVAAVLGLALVTAVVPHQAGATEGDEVTVYDRTVEWLENEFDERPETATLNGEEISTEEALEWLKENGGDRPLDASAPEASEELDSHGEDTGFGIRTRNFRCHHAAWVSASSFPWDDGAGEDPLTNVETTGAPDGEDPCTGETITLGTVSGDINLDTSAWQVCVENNDVAGGWVNSNSDCYRKDLTRPVTSAEVTGRVLHTEKTLCFGDPPCLVFEDLRGGFVTAEPTTDEDVQEDLAVIEVEVGS